MEVALVQMSLQQSPSMWFSKVLIPKHMFSFYVFNGTVKPPLSGPLISWHFHYSDNPK